MKSIFLGTTPFFCIGLGLTTPVSLYHKSGSYKKTTKFYG